MSEKYKIKVNNKSETIKVIEILLKNGYLFFELLRFNNLQNIIAHINRYGDDGLLYIEWIITGYTDCNRIFGLSPHLSESYDDSIFGKMSLYKIVTVEEFLEIKQSTPNP